jgi:predicted nucleic acid-binding protein
VSVVVSDTSPLHYLILCGLAVIGTVGLIEEASKRGLLDLPAILERLQSTNARLDPALVQAALERDRRRKQGPFS